MKVSVFGLGYVGTVTAGCLARAGFQVVGVDPNAEKADRVARGLAPIIEFGLSELIAEGVRSGRLTAGGTAADAVVRTDVSIVCVGTPTGPDGAPNMGYVHGVVEEIGEAVRAAGKEHVVVIRSTVLPGTTVACRRRLDALTGEGCVAVAFNPEFLREGSAIRDFDTPAYTVIGTEDPRAEAAVRALYAGLDAPVLCVPTGVAECIKFGANAWHAAKITFANEMGRLCKALGVDGRRVMDVLVQDTKLNVSATYMRPGFAYGGSCLPKDLRALNYLAERHGVDVPLLGSLDRSNALHVRVALERVLSHGGRRVGVVGVAFKPGTDDLRESPVLDLVRELIAAGREVRILDAAVREATLIGANRAFVEARLPSLPALLVERPAELAAHAEVLVVAHGGAGLKEVLRTLRPGTTVVDLSGAAVPPEGCAYDGLGW